MYDVINVTLCHSKSKLNPPKHGLTGPYPTTYTPTRIPTRQIGILINILFQQSWMLSKAEYKINFMKPTKLIFQRIETLAMKVANKVVSFNWWKTSDTHRDSLQHASKDLYPRSQLLPSSWQCQCQLLPPNDLLARCAEWRRTYVPRWKQSDSQHLPWCMLTET